jgi:hypothetical protein
LSQTVILGEEATVKKHHTSCAVVLSLLVTSIPVWAEVKSFVGKGAAVVIHDDKEGAQRLAYDAAKRRALTEAMRSLLQKGQKDEMSFNLLKPELLKGPFPYLHDEVEVFREQKGKMLTVEVAVSVDMKKLKQHLGREGVLVTENKEKKKAEFPAVMVIITEEISGKVNTDPYTTAVVSNHLIKNGYEVLDEGIVRKNITQEQAVQAVNGYRGTANAVALQYGSGIVITGKTAVQPSALKSGGMQAYGANLTLRATKADTGDVLATASADGSYPHINAMTGSRKAAEVAAQKAIVSLVEDLEKSMESSRNDIVMTISPINYKQLAILKKILTRDFENISTIRQKSFVGKIAKIDVQIEGSITDFADEIALKDFGSFTLDVLQFSPGKIDMSLELK